MSNADISQRLRFRNDAGFAHAAAIHINWCRQCESRLPKFAIKVDSSSKTDRWWRIPETGNIRFYDN
ncbi:MAG: hypothetical protein IPG99_11635 [Ignavibacteria bacterium]|nr:hypothetical protein [Ignavibacteria bacterium]